jgi:Dna[CI] antecedent, DciA
MPKNPVQNKKSIRGKRSSPLPTKYPVAPQSLGRIMKDQGWMQQLDQVRSLQQDWVEWLRTALPEELGSSIVNVVQKGPELRVLAISAAWSARLRYALAALAPQLQEHAPVIVKVTVRVAPAGRSDTQR